MKQLLLFVLGLGMAATVGAADVAGVKLPDRVPLSGTELLLNGAGVRSTPVSDIYVGALYVPKRHTSLAGVVDSGAPRRVHMALLIDATAEQLVPSFLGGLAKNHAKAQMEAMKPEIDQLAAIIKAVSEVRGGQSLYFDFVPGTGTVISHDGVAKGTIPGDAFNAALLRIWLGEQPASESLKKAMLGG